MRKLKFLIIISIITSALASCDNNSMPKDLEKRKENINNTIQNLEVEKQNIQSENIQTLIEKYTALNNEIKDYTAECNKRGIEKNNDKIINTINGKIDELKSKNKELRRKVAVCRQWNSKTAVENRIESLGYRLLSIRLNSSAESECRYQWIVQVISDQGHPGWCAMTTDGSSGTVEIVNVTCN